MRVAVMQPYFFPYWGYFQLVAAVDTFVFYDDVSFIKKGWINRNQILVNGKPFLFTVPVEDASQNRKICDTHIHLPTFIQWRQKFLKNLSVNYRGTLNYNSTIEIIEKILYSNHQKISDLAIDSVRCVSEVLGLSAGTVSSRSFNLTASVTGEDRIIRICKILNARTYINAKGGMHLYSRENFEKHDLHLCFLNPVLFTYTQKTTPFVEGLSIIDILMNCSWDFLRDSVHNYQLI